MTKNKPSGRYRTGRYFMSKAQMREAKFIREMLASKVKRGEIKSFKLYQCGCGCGVGWSEEKADD